MRIGLSYRLVAAVALFPALGIASAAGAQVRFGVPGEPVSTTESYVVCRGSGGQIFISFETDDCGGYVPYQFDAQLIIGPDPNAIVFDGLNGTATFNGTTNLNGPTNINGGLTLNGSIAAAGITSSAGLANTGNFSNNGAATITGALTAGSLGTGGGATVGGQATVGSLVSNGQVRGTSLFTNGPATVQGFFNAQNGASLQGNVQVGTLQVFQGATFNGLRVQGVAAPVAGTDAANRNYVDAGDAAAQAALTAVGAELTRQAMAIAATTDTNVLQSQQISDVQAVNTRQDQELADVRTVNVQQAAQIAAAQTVNARQDAELGDVRTVNTRQDRELGDVRSVNASQSTQLTTQAGQISAIQALDAAQSQQILALQQGQATLFDLTRVNQRQISKANEGVAMALAMESPSLPPGTSFALSGGVGYFNNRSAATTAITARIADRASFSAGVGVGFKSGEVGARSGFQIAW